MLAGLGAGLREASGTRQADLGARLDKALGHRAGRSTGRTVCWMVVAQGAVVDGVVQVACGLEATQGAEVAAVLEACGLDWARC